MSNLKIDQEEFNRKAQHILDTVVRPQVERYEKAKAAEQKNKMTAVEYIEYMWMLQGAIYKNDIDKALEMEKEQRERDFKAGNDSACMEHEDIKDYFDKYIKSEQTEDTLKLVLNDIKNTPEDVFNKQWASIKKPRTK